MRKGSKGINTFIKHCINQKVWHSHLAGSAVPAGGETGLETEVGDRAPTPAAEAAAAAECPVQQRNKFINVSRRELTHIRKKRIS